MEINNIIKIWGSLGETPSAQTFLDRLRGLRSVEDPDTLIGVLVKGFIHKSLNPRDAGRVISTKTIVDFIQQSLSIEIGEDKYPVVEDLLETMGIKKISTHIIPDDSAVALYDYHIHYTPISSNTNTDKETWLMKYHNHKFKPITVFGKVVLFTRKRLDKKGMPDNVHMYLLRHGYFIDKPEAISDSYTENYYYGTIISDEKFPTSFDGKEIPIIHEYDIDQSDAIGKYCPNTLFDYLYKCPETGYWHIFEDNELDWPVKCDKPIGPLITTLKVFIEIAGVPDKDIKSIREKIIIVLTRRMPYNTIDLIIPDEDPPKPGLKNSKVDMLIRGIRCLADADLVVFFGDFTKSKICCAELAVCKEYNISYITMNESDINTGFRLDFNNYVVFISDKIPTGCIYVSDGNYAEDVIVTRFPCNKFINLKTHPDSYMSKEFTETYPEYAVINNDTASELVVDIDGLGDVISIARPNPFTSWGLSKTREPVIID